MFRSLFNRKKANSVPEVAGLTIGRSVTIDPIELKLLGVDTLLEPPQTGFMICAQGHCDLGEQSHLHRFYTDDDRYLLQIQGGDGYEDDRVDEIMLWYAYDVQYPSRDADWNDLRTRQRQSRFDLQAETSSVAFKRAWFGHSDMVEDPMTYWEDVRETRDSAAPSRIFQTAMLFGRGLSDGRDEMLLVNLEEPEDGERSASFLIGRVLPRHALIT
ncbi:hypothetical protein PhaeoP83_00030 [Phaeobacter inhibens]|uniref:DUF2491 domain-containing protein n=1 Tax=Phaeobacter inhibens TaxID=221822 RepID=A0ABM6R908_9RHOB|nr:DUF2491 family protein [Phaeobacter inhibens]AUQ48360.1 hypothetical protein PhaeoP83_00030 [Phaeobacter inhibens]AUQ92867.1 hypothetical protein PhaeoP66_00030 [Phaeobacter inhibens]AUR18163.1 hypothetical protein PhaeoP80_00030 [Phaeobacter inhibens]